MSYAFGEEKTILPKQATAIASDSAKIQTTTETSDLDQVIDADEKNLGMELKNRINRVLVEVRIPTLLAPTEIPPPPPPPEKENFAYGGIALLVIIFLLLSKS